MTAILLVISSIPELKGFNFRIISVKGKVADLIIIITMIVSLLKMVVIMIVIKIAEGVISCLLARGDVDLQRWLTTTQ